MGSDPFVIKPSMLRMRVNTSESKVCLFQDETTDLSEGVPRKRLEEYESSYYGTSGKEGIAPIT